jgi:hypothetical protein
MKELYKDEQQRYNYVVKLFDIWFEDIIHQTLFEPIINYCDKYFVKTNSLYLINGRGWTTAFIASTDEKANDKRYKHEIEDFVQVEHLEDATYEYKKLKFNLFDIDKEYEVFYYKKR